MEKAPPKNKLLQNQSLTDEHRRSMARSFSSLLTEFFVGEYFRETDFSCKKFARKLKPIAQKFTLFVVEYLRHLN